MSRFIAFDTETTGLLPEAGHRIVQIGLVEINRRPAGGILSILINPERNIDPGAQAVHGISIEQLQDQPTFSDIALTLLERIRGAHLIIHNAPFDIGFLDSELNRLGIQWGHISDHCDITCTRKLAREKLTGWKTRHSLNNLCDHYGIKRNRHQPHSALTNAKLLAQVWQRLKLEVAV